MKNRRSLALFFFAIFLLIGISSCKDDKETFTVHPQPNWEVVNNEGYPVSMTAVVRIPENLSAYASEGDELAAFAGETCRGVGEILKNVEGVEGVYYVTIKGTFDEEVDIYFQYYSERNKYLYKTAALFVFEKDKVYGTADSPSVLPLNVVE